MFVGHYSASFALKSARPAVPLWVLFLAVQAVEEMLLRRKARCRHALRGRAAESVDELVDPHAAERRRSCADEHLSPCQLHDGLTRTSPRRMRFRYTRTFE